jgi:hypothetical protein
MITRTGLQVITDALKLLGVVAGHEVPTSAEQQDSFARLHELIDSWGTQAQTMYLTARVIAPLVPAVQTYSIGPGATINAARPMAIDAAAYLTASVPPVEVSVEVLFDQAYVGEPTKTLTGAAPQAISYTASVPFGSVWVWPVPTAAVSLVLYYAEPIAQFPDLVTPVDLAPGYAKALRCNLAIELAPEFGRVVDPTVERLARESLADIKRQNLPLVEIGIDAALTGGGGGYDILTDG